MGDLVIDRRSSAPFARRSWPARPRQLAPLRAEVRRWLAPLDLAGQAEDDLVAAVSEAASSCVEHAYSWPTAENIDLLDRTPRVRRPDHRPRRVAHCVRPTQPLGQGNRDYATAHRVRSDPPRHWGNTGVPAASVAGPACDASQPTPSVSTLRKKGDVVATTGEARFAAEPCASVWCATTTSSPRTGHRRPSSGCRGWRASTPSAFPSQRPAAGAASPTSSVSTPTATPTRSRPPRASARHARRLHVDDDPDVRSPTASEITVFDRDAVRTFVDARPASS